MKDDGTGAAKAGEDVAAEPAAASSRGRGRKTQAGTDGEGAAAAAKKSPAEGRGKKAATAKEEEPEAEEPAASEAASEEEAEEEAAPKRAAKRAKTGAKTKADKAGGEDEEKPKPARKSRAKPAAKEAEGDAGAEAKPKAKRGAKQPAAAANLVQYTAALRKPAPPAGSPTLNILSWNVAGLRALLKKTPDAVSSLVAREGAEAMCLQEHKLQADNQKEVEALLGLQGWHHAWAFSTAKLGYSGVSVHTRSPPLSVMVGLGHGGPGAADPDPEHEGEGRVVTVELEGLFLVNVYVPNSGEGLKRLDYRVGRWDGAFAAFLRGLQARGKPVVVTGDLNCAHKEIDIHSPKTNLRSAGFTVEERESFGRLLLGEAGLADTFRRLYPDTVAYTYFTRRFNCREKNKGWRLDYFLTSESMMPPEAQQEANEGEGLKAGAWAVYDTWIMQDVYGSDHLPLGLTCVKKAAA